MNRGGSDEACDRWSIAFGVLGFAATLVFGTLVLLGAAVGAAIGLGFALMTIPWLMPLLALVLKRQWRRCERSGVRRERASAVVPRGNASLTRPGRGPIPAH
jgi:hypothetical protein